MESAEFHLGLLTGAPMSMIFHPPAPPGARIRGGDENAPMSLFRRKHSGVEPLKPAEPDEAKNIPMLHEELCMIRAPRSQIAEQFRSLRNSIAALNPEGAPRTIVLTSALRGEGKSVAAINLALSMAEVPGTRALLVDADLHHPALESYLGLPRRQGLTELLRGQCSLDRAVRATSATGVSILGAGQLPDNPSQLLGSERMRTVIASFKRRFSYILIDTPEAMTVSDASLLGSMADGVILVVRLYSTPRHYVEQTHHMLETMGGNVLGMCLTAANVVDTAADYARRS
jgi:capsular exopolysaccharide synthesis family protein